jgi:hypothetical protein
MDLKQITKLDFTSYKTIIFAALIIRLIAAVFSQGYGMHDDHFLIIEASTSWVSGYDYNNWLPWSPGNQGHPEGHSFTYVGLNYIFFYVLKFIGITDPKTLMLFNRLVHALLSLLVVHFGFKITERLSNRNNAVTVGWLLALTSVIPFMSVRNLVELTSIPFLMWGVWLIVSNGSKKSVFYAGLLIGLAVSFRFQIAVFTFGLGGYYLLKKQWGEFLMLALGSFVTFAITQGLVDYFIWGYPFAEFLGYALYNMKEGTQYLPNSNYFMYLWVLMGVLLFPLGVLIAIGFFKSAKKYWLLFLPTMFFFLFHSFYPNRQERFILTILPFFIILGVMGLEQWRAKDKFRKFWRGSLIAFWVLNIPLVFILSFHYTKKSRVEAMYAIYGNGMENEHILLEGSRQTKPSMLPKFYADSWYCGFRERTEPTQLLTIEEGLIYDYVFFFGKDDLEQRISDYKGIYPALSLVKKCEPSFLDNVAREVNPRNTNQYIEVWKTNVKR